MNFVKTFVDRWHRLIRELAKFGIIGVVNTAIDFGLFNLLQISWEIDGQQVLLHGAPLKATVVATVISATSSFYMNRHWTFRHRERSHAGREFTLFFVFNAIGLAIQLGMLGLAKYGFGVTDLWWLNAVKVLAVGVGTVFRFWTYQTWVFRHPEDAIYEPEIPIEAIAAEAHHKHAAHTEKASLGDPR